MEEDSYPIIIWLQMLPDDVYEKAVRAIRRQRIKYTIDCETYSFNHAICSGFVWDTSKEGWDYWSQIRQQYQPLIDTKIKLLNS